MAQQTAKAILMVRPVDFNFNAQSAADNHFMKQSQADPLKIKQTVLQEYDIAIQILRNNDIFVLSFDKENYPQLKNVQLPDAVFPNNHFSTTSEGNIYTYPMLNQSRESEKLQHPFMFKLLKQSGFTVKSVNHIQKNIKVFHDDALESTGALILDHLNRIVYVSLSQRATREMVEKWCQLNCYEHVSFESHDQNGKEIYHTNMILSIGEKYAIICKDLIYKTQREKVIERLSKNRLVIDITVEQCLVGFLGNCLEVQSFSGKSMLVMSKRAEMVLTNQQRKQIEQFSQIIGLPVDTIEEIGGGSARCMMAEIFNPNKYLL